LRYESGSGTDIRSFKAVIFIDDIFPNKNASLAKAGMNCIVVDVEAGEEDLVLVFRKCALQ